jgi:hypothetical protein
MKKQMISLLLSLVLVLSLLSPLSALAAEKSGSAGDQVTWSLDAEAGVLSFTGTGRMYSFLEFQEGAAPMWWGFGDSIREIRFAEGITSITDGLFSMTHYASCTDMERLRNVRSVRIPASIAWIGLEAFAGCTRLDEIVILNPDCVIEDDAEYSTTLGVPGRTVVVGYPDSTAERYAKRYGFTFRAIGCAEGGHVFNDTVVTPQTCTRDGVMESECVLCGYKTRRAIPASHNYEITERLARTVYTCTRCGDSYVAGECRRMKLEETVTFTVNAGTSPCLSFTPEKTDYYYFDLLEIEALSRYGYLDPFGKVYDSSGAVVEEHGTTLLEAGKTYYYTVSHIYDDDLKVQAQVTLIHNYVQTGGTATCTEGGTIVDTCTVCGETFVDEVGPLGHDYCQTSFTAPTCTREGLAEYTCSRCGKRYTERLDPAHRYVYDADLPWYRHAVCSLCGDVQTRGIPDPPALTLDTTVSARLDADNDLCCFRYTATKDENYRLQTDLQEYGVYGAVYDADGNLVHAAGYDTEYLSIEGLMIAGETYYFVIEPYRELTADFTAKLEIAHLYDEDVKVPPSCTSEGLTVYTCVYCGDTYSEVLPESHDWEYDEAYIRCPWYSRMTCTLCGKTVESGTLTPPELSLGREFQPQLDEYQRAFYRFTPEKTEAYRLRFTAPCGARGVWYLPDGMNHSWGEDVCALEAGQTYFLGVYGDEEETALPPVILEVAHDYTYVTAQAPTCTEDGRRVGLCRFCGDTVTEVLPASHDLEYDVETPWYWRGVCRVCGQTVEGGSRAQPELRLGETVNARIDEARGMAFFRIRPEEDGIYSFTFGRDCYCEVYTADGSMFDRSGYHTVGDAYRMTSTLYGGQTFYLQLYFGNRYRTGDVFLKADLVETVSIPALELNAQVHGNEGGWNNDTYYRFTAQKAGVYELALNSAAYFSAYVSVRDAAGDPLDVYERKAYDSCTLRFRLEAGQSCVAEVFASEPFDLVLRQADTLFDSTPLTPGRYETASFDAYNDAAWFRFTPEQSGWYEFASYSGDYTGCALFDADMKLLDYAEDGRYWTDFVLRCDLEAGKTYYFRVEKSNWGKSAQFPVRLRRSVNWSEPEYYWEGQNLAHAVCYDRDNFSNQLEEVVQVTRLVLKEPTYTERGEEMLIAMFENDMFETQTRIRSIPVLTAPPLPCDGLACPGSHFTDMPAKTHWAHDAIDWALVTGVTTGTGETTFSPDAGCTRAQVATFLWRAAGKPEPKDGDNPFVDVYPDAYYYKAVLWAQEQGITTGTSSNKFSPDAVCTRAQIVTFLWRFDGKKAASGAAFSDVPAGAYYETAVTWAAENGVTTGTAEGKFSPDSTCTRAQVVTFLHRKLA